MKTLERKISEIYRFRCDRCQSKFEMTGEEKHENDLKQDPKSGRNYPFHFDCPVCNARRYVLNRDMHLFYVMDTGREHMVY